MLRWSRHLARAHRRQRFRRRDTGSCPSPPSSPDEKALVSVRVPPIPGPRAARPSVRVALASTAPAAETPGRGYPMTSAPPAARESIAPLARLRGLRPGWFAAVMGTAMPAALPTTTPATLRPCAGPPPCGRRPPRPGCRLPALASSPSGAGWRATTTTRNRGCRGD